MSLVLGKEINDRESNGDFNDFKRRHRKNLQDLKYLRV